MESLHRDPFLSIAKYVHPLCLINLLKTNKRFHLLISGNQEFWSQVWNTQFSTLPLTEKRQKRIFLLNYFEPPDDEIDYCRICVLTQIALLRKETAVDTEINLGLDVLLRKRSPSSISDQHVRSCQDPEIFSLLFSYENSMISDNLLLCLKFGMTERFKKLYPRNARRLSLSKIAKMTLEMKNLEIIKLLQSRRVVFESDNILETNDLEIITFLERFLDISDPDYFNYLLDREIVEFLIREKNLSTECISNVMINYIVNLRNADYLHFLPQYPAIFDHILTTIGCNNIEIFTTLLPFFQTADYLKKIAENLLETQQLELIKLIPKEYFQIETVLFRGNTELFEYFDVSGSMKEKDPFLYSGKILEYLIKKGLISNLEENPIPLEFYQNGTSETWRILVKYGVKLPKDYLEKLIPYLSCVNADFILDHHFSSSDLTLVLMRILRGNKCTGCILRLIKAGARVYRFYFRHMRIEALQDLSLLEKIFIARKGTFEGLNYLFYSLLGSHPKYVRYMLKNGYKINPNDRMISEKILAGRFSIPQIDVVLSKGYSIDLLVEEAKKTQQRNVLIYLKSKGANFGDEPYLHRLKRNTIEDFIFED